MFYESHMGQALEEAKISSRIGEVPIGAVIINSADGALIASCGNRVETLKDPTAHAEILALREAAKLLKTPRLKKCDLYVTLEPCAMCAQAISLARIRRLYYAVEDQKGGGPSTKSSSTPSIDLCSISNVIVFKSSTLVMFASATFIKEDILAPFP